MIIVPFSDSNFSAFIQEITIDDRVYKFRFYWNDRFKYWSMSIFDFEDNIILHGIKLVVNYELLNPFRHLEIPRGALYIIDTTDNINKIGRNDMDVNCRLLYLTEAEIATL